MSLESTRSKTLEFVRAAKDLVDEKTVAEWAKKWFEFYKAWEAEETFERAFKDGRMTGRLAKQSGSTTFAVYDAKRQKTMIKLDPSISGTQKALNPANFIDKKKNELGLHDVSAVLLKPDLSIIKQLFSKAGSYVVFMPLPLEEDLQLFAELSEAAKHKRDGELYKVVVDSRSRMTRIKYGSEDDMRSGFLNVDKGDGKNHFRYSAASILGNPFPPGTLKQRSVNALYYKSKIAAVASTQSANNEVTIKYRQHKGIFPLIGSQGPIPKGAHESIPQEIKADEFLLANFDKPIGKLSDKGVLTKF